ncbi:flagellar basal body-associated FliL family protein [Pacificoceanicola onchidii]|uniref:flagellar basal body-associated FliL family protein n=1 Tax=Pacificoceanicola onchidii TaxID=2562685 RepID=UPI0010A61A10|nr:flagellar basal body-associated FliL family protein [Pacificoceanicola onchidii]
MRKLLPILLALIGTGAGVGAGFFLMPAPEEHAEGEMVECITPEEYAKAEKPPEEEHEPETREYVKLNNQFVIPIMSEDRVSALVVAALSVEVTTGSTEIVYTREPKLRDVFLQVLFDHANIGGFKGNFTNGGRMEDLRGALLEAARPVLGDAVSDVLITEIARQDS